MLMPLRQLKALQAAARRHFAGTLTPHGRDFEFVLKLFICAFDSNLNQPDNWLPTARLLRLVLSQSVHGYWNASSTTAFALLARQAAETQHVPITMMDRLRALLSQADTLGIGDAAEMADGVDAAGQAGDAGEAERGCAGDDVLAATSKKEDAAAAAAAARGADHRTRTVQVLRHVCSSPVLTKDDVAAMESSEVIDCPLTFSTHALRESIPLELAILPAEAQVQRVWTTLCVIAVCERMRVCWLDGDGDDTLSAPIEATIVDAARCWLQRHAASVPQVAGALEGEAGQLLSRAATACTVSWHRTWIHRVTLLRREEAMTSTLTANQAERAGRMLIWCLQTRHPTLSAFLAPAGRYRRWQQLMITFTIVISCLCMNIWMFELKGVNCCAALRALLNDGPDGGACPPGNGPCRGATATCSDLATQFASVPVLPAFPDGLADWQCDAFPDDARFADTVLVALLSIAAALPVTMFILICFDLANDNDPPQSFLRWGLSWPLLVFGGSANRRWHYTRAEQPRIFVRWFIRFRYDPLPTTLCNLAVRAWCMLTGAELPWYARARAAEEERFRRQVNALSSDAPLEARPQDDEELGTTHTLSAAAVEVLDCDTMAGCVSSSVSAPSASEMTESEGEEDEDDDVAADIAFKRGVMALGFCAVYVCWALFSWFIFVYGMLIYTHLGGDAQESFSRSFGISYGLSQVSEWRDVASEALRTIVVFALLERLFLTPPAAYLEDHIDFLSVQAVMLTEKLSFAGRVRTHLRFTQRMARVD
jgi:hypothetical protein